MAVKPEAPTRASEEILAAPVADLVRDLGLAVAAANKALKDAGGDVVYTIPAAEVELKVAISIRSERAGRPGTPSLPCPWRRLSLGRKPLRRGEGPLEACRSKSAPPKRAGLQEVQR